MKLNFTTKGMWKYYLNISTLNLAGLQDLFHATIVACVVGGPHAVFGDIVLLSSQ